MKNNDELFDKKESQKDGTNKIPILTKQERQVLLENYELDSKDIRLLEKVPINEARVIINEIRNKFPKHRFMAHYIFSNDYVIWHEKYANEYYIRKKAQVAETTGA